jgi:hypothetical protein
LELNEPDHHEPDRTQVQRYGPAVYPGRLVVPGECGGEGGAVKPSGRLFRV